MDKRRRKQFKALRTGHPIVSIASFIVMCVLMSMIVWGLAGLIVNYIVDSKLGAEYNDLQYMGRVYETAVDMADRESVYKLLDAEGRDYCIFDSDGDILYEHGENTASLTAQNAFLLYTDDEEDDNTNRIMVRTDTKIPLLSVSESGHIDYNVIEVISSFGDLMEYTSEVGTASVGGWAGEIFNLSGAVVKIPMWIDMPLGDSGEVLCGKVFIKLNMTDAFWLFLLFGLLAILVLVLFIVILVNLIKELVRRRNAAKIFFTDLSTHGKNWMWFLLRGEHYMRSSAAKRDTFAVVNLVFVNYRNFCICHSIADGDELLKKIDAYLNKHIHKKEMCARVTGAEFALLLRFNEKNELQNRLNEIVKDLQHIDDEHIFHFQAGVELIGIARYTGGKIIKRRYFDMEIAYNNACTTRSTMEGSEESGIAFFNESMVADRKWIDSVQEKQRQAIENEEFQVYYQPKYDPQTDELKGAEALIRWISPDFGFVPPGKIIPIFEKNGFITEIDHYMITHVARDQKRWLDLGFRCVPVSVNVSRAHFIENDLAEQIRDMVDEVGTPHEYIEIELTESAFFDDKKALLETITRLKGYGFVVSMDDFGSGYSSLNSLKDMPLDVLKLDAEFFRGEDSGVRGEIVVSEAIRLAKSLNMRTVAEGVEVKEQVDFLASQGCDMIQGYYYAKPMPGPDYETRMRDNEANLKRAAESVEAAEYAGLFERGLDAAGESTADFGGTAAFEEVGTAGGEA